MNIEEGKALNHLIHMEERIIRLLKSLEDQGEISETEKKNDLLGRRNGFQCGGVMEH